MAISSLSLALSFLLLSLLAIALAGDYSDASSKYGFTGISADSPQAKPEAIEKSQYGSKPDYYTPRPVEKEKSGYGDDSSKNDFNEGEKPNYGSKYDTYKPKPEENEKSDYNNKPYDVKPKSEEEVKSNYGAKQDTYKQKSEEKEKLDYNKMPEGEEKPNYGSKPDTYKSKPEEKEKPDYNKKPYDVKTKPEGEKPNYGSKQDNYNPKPEEKEKSDYNKKPYDVKPKPEGEMKPNYGAEQNTYKPKPEEKVEYNQNTYFVKPEEMKNRRLSIAIQGLVLCKTSSDYYPIQGASATITCKAIDEAGVEKTISTCSKATDGKGYFFAALPDDKLIKLKECKAYLKSSPLETCNVPTNVNKGIKGALLSSFRVLKDKNTKLYSVGPFFYTSSQAKPSPNYGY